MSDDIDRRLRGTDPLTADPARRAAAAHPAADLREAIMMSTPTRTVPRRRSRRPLLTAAITSAVAVAAVIGIYAVAVDRPSATGGTIAGSPGSTSLDGSYYLIGDPTWEIDYTDDYATVDYTPNKEIQFASGGSGIDLFWRPLATHEGYVSDRRNSAAEESTVTIDGVDATLFRYEGGTDFTALWLTDYASMELRGMFATREDYLAVAATLRRVDEATWLAALPDSVVAPDESDTVVAEMIADIPLPDGVDATSFDSEAGAKDRYQIGAYVAGVVACGWISQWLTATESGDASAAQEAVAAMATSRQWAVLVEMDATGDYPELLWGYADAIANGGVFPGPRRTPVADDYVDDFRCPSGD